MYCALLSTNQLQSFVTILCFGCVFLWVLSGRYLENEHRYSGSYAPGGNILAAQWQTRKHVAAARFVYNRRLLEAKELRATAIFQKTARDGGLRASAYNTATAQCSGVHKLNSSDARCKYVRTVDSCQNDNGLLVYLNFIYCVIPYRLIPLAMIVLFLWLVFLFIFLGATAEEYFCPALTVMSQVLHLSQNVAGVTLLALGNGAPDIFSAFAAINQSDDRKSSLAIGALFGAGIFVTTVVIGGVAFLTQFELTKRPFFRDIIFYTVAVYWTFYLLWTSTVTIYMATGFIALYVVYVVVVIAGRLVYQKWKRDAMERLLNASMTKPAVPVILGGTKHNEKEGEREKSKEREVLYLSTENSTETESEAQVYQGGILQVTTEEEDTSEHQRLTCPPPPPAHSDNRLSGDESSRKYIADTPLYPQLRGLLTPPIPRRSVSPTPSLERGWRYAQRRRGRTWDGEERPRSATPRKLIEKSLTGALDVSEEVVAAVGLPHVPQIWEEIQRIHRKSPLTISTRSRRSEDGSQQADEETGEDEPADETTPLMLEKPKRQHPFVFLLSALFPFGDDFKRLGIVGKIYEIVKYPCGLSLTLTVPVIDHGADLHDWNRWLNIVHCVTGPMAVVLLTKSGLHLIRGVFPVWTLILIIGVLVAIVVACTSRNDKPPIYHCAFAWLGFAIAVVWIYVIANEIVNLLQAFGVVVKLSDGILGITLLAWGNSIGDAVANMTMARQGYPRMAISACYGGPLLNMLIGVGVASLYKTIGREADGFQFKLYFTQVELFAAAFLMASLALSLVTIAFSKFRIYRPFAVCLLLVYVVFLIVSILAEIPVFTLTISGVLPGEGENF